MKIGYLEKHPNEGCYPEFKKSLSRWDNEADWIKIVYCEVQES